LKNRTKKQKNSTVPTTSTKNVLSGLARVRGLTLQGQTGAVE